MPDIESKATYKTPRITVDYEKPRLNLPGRLRQGLVLVLFVVLFILGSILMLVVATLTLFQARRLYAEVVGKNLARLGLWIHGVRLVVHHPGSRSESGGTVGARSESGGTVGARSESGGTVGARSESGGTVGARSESGGTVGARSESGGTVGARSESGGTAGRTGSWPEGQVVYISNHTSALDVLVIIALGLPNARFFMGGFLRTIVPIWIIAGCMGTFWTPRQTFPEKRRALFRRASKLLSRTGESVFLTPEGQRCWVFNRGAFHLAMSLKAPIIPFFITIPPDTDPGPWTGNHGMEIRRGEVHVHFKPPIQTTEWTEADIDRVREETRRMYYDWGVELNDKSVRAPEAADLATS